MVSLHQVLVGAEPRKAQPHTAWGNDAVGP
jgi:hypothetical protein